MGTKGKYLTSIERAVVLKFRMFKIHFEQLKSSGTQPKAVRLREIIRTGILTVAKYLNDCRITCVSYCVLEPIRDLGCQYLL